MADRGRPFGLERLRARAHRRSGRGVPRILLPFAIYTAIVVLIVALGAFWLVRRDATVRAERAAADHAVRIAAVLGEELRRPDLAAPMSPERRAQLDQLVRNAAVGPDVLRAKLYGTDGTVLYSSDHELIGTRTDDMGELREVLGGATVRGVEPLDHERAGPGPQGAKAVEVYVPVRLDAAGAPVGVFEVYEDYAPVAAQIRDAITPIAAIFGAALLLLYAALFPIVLRASRRLRRQVAENEHLALHDSLTGLPNRVHFQEALARVLAGPEADAGVAVLVMDLDLFKEINDTLGHDQGDHVLVEVARRLEGGFRLSDTVARLGGDEFAVCLTGVPDPEAVRRRGAEIQPRGGQPSAVGEAAVAVDAGGGEASRAEWGRRWCHSTARIPIRFSSARTSPCTRPRPRDPGASSTIRNSTRGARSSSRWRGTSGARSSGTSWWSTTSPRSTFERMPSAASRRSSAGSTRGSAPSPRRGSPAWRGARAPSAPSPGRSCGGPRRPVAAGATRASRSRSPSPSPVSTSSTPSFPPRCPRRWPTPASTPRCSSSR